MSSPTVHRLLAAAASSTFDDPENARTIHLVAFGLIVVALALAAVTAWWWIASRIEHPALGPLEVMSSKRWRDADDGLRRVRLDAARRGEDAVVDLEEVGEVEEIDASPLPPRFAAPARSTAPRDPLLQARRGH